MIWPRCDLGVIAPTDGGALGRFFLKEVLFSNSTHRVYTVPVPVDSKWFAVEMAVWFLAGLTRFGLLLWPFSVLV